MKPFDLNTLSIIVNLLCSIFIALWGFLQWKISYDEKQSKLFKNRMEHFITFNNLWENFKSFHEYYPNYKAIFKKPDDYSEITKLKNNYELHYKYSICYFNQDLINLEKEFINKIIEILQSYNCDANIIHQETKIFDNLYKDYDNLQNEFLKQINKNTFKYLKDQRAD